MLLSQLLPLLSAIFVFGLGFFILFRNIRSSLNIVFFFLSIVVSIWLLGTYKMFVSITDTEVIYWDKFIYIGVTMIPALFHHFATLFTQNKSHYKSIWLAYIIGIFFMIMIKTPYFVDGVFHYAWGVHTKAQILHHLFLIYYGVFIGLLFYNLYNFFNKTKSGLARTQTRYVLLAFTFLIVIGSFGFLPAYGISVYPFAYVSGLLFVSVLAYAIIRHRFMDIRLIIKRSTVTIMSIASAMAISYFVYSIFSWNFPRVENWEGLGLLLGLILLQPLRTFYTGIANRFFFTDLYDYQEVLRDLSHHLTSIISLEDITDSIINTVNDSFRLENSGLILCDEKYDNIECDVMMAYGLRSQELYKIIDNNLLLKYLTLSRAPLLADEVPLLTKSIIDKPVVASLLQAKQKMEKSKIAILAPLVKEDKLIGIIALGGKLSRESYSNEDVELIDTLANQASVAIDNAQLYDQINKFNIKLKKKVKEATTDLQKTNRKLTYANDNLQQLDKAKSEFLSIASHQLRTPLTGIKGYLSMLLDGDFGKLPRTAKQIIQELFENSDRMTRLINTFLDISRIEANKLVLNKKDIDITDLVKSTVHSFMPAAVNKKLYLKCICSSKKVIVFADGDKIRDVLMNFIDNSIKYTKKGYVKVGMKVTAGHVKVFVIDSGMGVSKKDIDKLFEKFARGTDITKIDTNGSGLGLYIAKKIIEAHGGVTFASSSGKNKGSKFGFSLPLPAKKKKPAKKK